jgi:hypothetical protein
MLVLLAGGAAVASSPAPVWLRSLVALPALVLGAGAALGLVVLRPTLDPTGEAADDDVEPASVMWWTLTVLLGLVVVLADALLLNVLRIRLTTTAIAIGIAAFGVVLLLLGQVSVGGQTLASGMRRPSVRARAAVWAAAVGVATVAVLGGAVAVARELQPSSTTAYGLLSLAGSEQDGQLTATAGRMTTVTWVLRGYEGLDVGAGEPRTSISLTGLHTGRPVEIGGRVLTRPAPVSDAGMRTGTTSFTAPDRAGIYRLALTVLLPTAAGGHEQLAVTANVTVRP